MRIYSYKGCQTCIVQPRCSSVCDAYKNSLKRKYKINVESGMSLDTAEEAVAQMHINIGNRKVSIDQEVSVKYNKLFGLSIEFDMEVKDGSR